MFACELPARNHVLEFDYMRGRFSDDWAMPRVVLASDEVIQSNRQTVTDFAQGLELVDDEGHPNRTDAQRHQVCHEFPLRIVLEQLLVRMRITGATDSQRYTGVAPALS